MKHIIEITLLDGTKVKLNTRLTLFTLLKAQNEGLMKQNVITTMAKTSQGQVLDPSEIDISDSDLLNLPYVCYLQNGNCKLSYEEFMNNLTFDNEIFEKVVEGVVTGVLGQTQNKFKEEFKNATPRNKSKNKKKYQKSK